MLISGPIMTASARRFASNPGQSGRCRARRRRLCADPLGRVELAASHNDGRNGRATGRGAIPSSSSLVNRTKVVHRATVAPRRSMVCRIERLIDPAHRQIARAGHTARNERLFVRFKSRFTEIAPCPRSFGWFRRKRFDARPLVEGYRLRFMIDGAAKEGSRMSNLSRTVGAISICIVSFVPMSAIARSLLIVTAPQPASDIPNWHISYAASTSRARKGSGPGTCGSIRRSRMFARTAAGRPARKGSLRAATMPRRAPEARSPTPSSARRRSPRRGTARSRWRQLPSPLTNGRGERARTARGMVADRGGCPPIICTKGGGARPARYIGG